MLKRACLFLLVSSCSVGSQQGYEPVQPIPFSHALHSGEYQVDCGYCHFAAERSRHAGLPPTSVCLNCHSQVKKDVPVIAQLRSSVEASQPTEWIKVHRLPDFVWFDHSRHVLAGGLKCQTCHGPVEQMVRVKQVETMTMGWCLDCHRRTAVESGGRKAPSTDCSVCHY